MLKMTKKTTVVWSAAGLLMGAVVLPTTTAEADDINGTQIPTTRAPRVANDGARRGEIDAQAHQRRDVQRASILLGASVYNPQDQELGTIEELVINRERGRVVYAVLERGGVAGLGETWIAVPFAALRHDPANERCVLSASPETLDNLEGFSEDAWPLTGEASLLPVVSRHDAGHAKADATAPNAGDQKQASTDRPTGLNDPLGDTSDRLQADWTLDPDGHWKNRVGELIGLSVTNPGGESLGELNDLAIDMERGQLAYGAVEFFEAWYDLQGKLIAVPWPRFSFGPDADGQLVLDATPQQLENADGFDADNWPDIDDTQWGAHTHETYDTQPYWMPGYGMPYYETGQAPDATRRDPHADADTGRE